MLALCHIELIDGENYRPFSWHYVITFELMMERNLALCAGIMSLHFELIDRENFSPECWHYVITFELVDGENCSPGC